MADLPDGTIPTTATVTVDETGLAKDVHIYNDADALSIYDHLKQIRTQIDTMLAEEQSYQQLWEANEATAQSITLDTKSNGKVVSIYAHATAATTFTVDVSNDNTNWVNVYTSPSAETDYSSSLTDAYKGFRYARLSSASAGVSGTDTVTLILAAK